MPRGGKREGAGRPPGVISKPKREFEAAIAATGETPRDYMLRVMRDPNTDPVRRDAMAKAVAPYVHPQLSSVKQDSSVTVKRAEDYSDDELATVAAGSGSKATQAPADTSKLN